MMNVKLQSPDEIATRLGATGSDMERQALESRVVESFRSARPSKDELARLLGFDGGDQVNGFLKAHEVFEPCTIEDVNLDVATLARFGF